MLHVKWAVIGSVLLVLLGIRSISWGQQPAAAGSSADPSLKAQEAIYTSENLRQLQVAWTAVSTTPQFHPLTEADVDANLASVKSTATALDERFASAGASAEGWKDFLSWAQFESELQKPSPDRTVLSSVYDKLASGYEGLELKWFANLRGALGDYLAVAGSMGNSKLKSAVDAQIEALQNEIKSMGPNPTTDQIRAMDGQILWLGMARQAPELVESVRARFSTPNFQVHIGKQLLDLGIGGPVDETAPVSDVILGTTIHGMGRTVGQTEPAMSPDSRFATFDADMSGINYSNTVGRNGPVCIFATGATGLAAIKRFWIDETGIHTYAATASANTATTINNIVSIKGRRFVEKIAWRRADKQKGEAEAIASQHAAGRLRARVDAQVDPQVQNANERFQAKVYVPLDERRAYPRKLGFATLASGLKIEGIDGLPTQLAAPSEPPALSQPADLAVYVHETMINNVAQNVFTGMRLTDEMVQRTAVELTGSVPEALKQDKNQEPFTIVFPPERIPRVEPVTVSFADNGFTVTLRGSEFISGDRHQNDTNVTASYKFVKVPEGYKAVRQGDLQIYGFRQKPGAKRSAFQQGLYTALQAKFGKIFQPEIKLQGFHFAQGRLASAGQFVPNEIISQNGWLAIGYARAAPAGVTAATN